MSRLSILRAAAIRLLQQRRDDASLLYLLSAKDAEIERLGKEVEELRVEVDLLQAIAMEIRR